MVISRKVGIFNVGHHVPFKTAHLTTLQTLVQILIHFLNAGIHIVQVPWKSRELRKHFATIPHSSYCLPSKQKSSNRASLFSSRNSSLKGDRKWAHDLNRGKAFFVVPVAMDRQRVSRFEDFGTHLALIIPRTVDIFNVIENVLFPSTSFVAHDANKQILFHFPHTRFDISWKWNASVGSLIRPQNARWICDKILYCIFCPVNMLRSSLWRLEMCTLRVFLELCSFPQYGQL